MSKYELISPPVLLNFCFLYTPVKYYKDPKKRIDKKVVTQNFPPNSKNLCFKTLVLFWLKFLNYQNFDMMDFMILSRHFC